MLCRTLIFLGENLLNEHSVLTNSHRLDPFLRTETEGNAPDIINIYKSAFRLLSEGFFLKAKGTNAG